MDNAERLLKYLKKKRYVSGDTERLKNDVATETVRLKQPTDLFIRDAMFGIGTILDEDLTDHCYIANVKAGLLGNVLVQALICRYEQDAEIVVYAREGLIPQGLKNKTMEKLKRVLC